MLSWDRDNSTRDTPVVDSNLLRGIAYAIPASILAWVIIVGLGYAGYMVGQWWPWQ